MNGYNKSADGYLVRYQPHLQLESHLLPMREGSIIITQGEKPFWSRVKSSFVSDIHNLLDKVCLGHWVEAQNTTEEILVYRFNGGEYFTEPMHFFIGNYLRLKLPNADVIVTQRAPRVVTTAGLPLNPQKDRICEALSTISGLKSAATYKEFWERPLHSATNSFNGHHYSTCEVLSA